MPHIDTSTIEGFQEMSAEAQVKALLALDVPEKVDLSGYVKKDLYDKTASDLSKAKKDLAGKMTADESAAAEQKAKWEEMEAKMAALQADNEKLQQERTESVYKSKYLAMPGFDEKLAEETAKAMAAGDMEKVFQNQQKANENYEKQLKADLLKQEGKLPGAGGSGGQEPEEVAFARKLGKEKAESAKQGGLDRFII